MITWIVIFSVIGLGKFVNLKGLMELLEMDHLFQFSACLKITFSKSMGLLDLVA
jgi:hypothetical protein